MKGIRLTYDYTLENLGKINTKKLHFLAVHKMEQYGLFGLKILSSALPVACF